MEKQKINRINELYRKSKAEGLTEAEKKEQKVLRAEYLELVRRNLRGQLNNIDIEETGPLSTLVKHTENRENFRRDSRVTETRIFSKKK